MTICLCLHETHAFVINLSKALGKTEHKASQHIFLKKSLNTIPFLHLQILQISRFFFALKFIIIIIEKISNEF